MTSFETGKHPLPSVVGDVPETSHIGTPPQAPICVFLAKCHDGGGSSLPCLSGGEGLHTIQEAKIFPRIKIHVMHLVHIVEPFGGFPTASPPLCRPCLCAFLVHAVQWCGEGSKTEQCMSGHLSLLPRPPDRPLPPPSRGRRRPRAILVPSADRTDAAHHCQRVVRGWWPRRSQFGQGLNWGLNGVKNERVKIFIF